jgi:hypothetical protein
MALSMSKSDSGSNEYLKCYGKAIKLIDDALSDEDKVKYMAKATKWTEAKPPPQVQQRCVCTHN